jgi:hypothetical protein
MKDRCIASATGLVVLAGVLGLACGCAGLLNPTPKLVGRAPGDIEAEAQAYPGRGVAEIHLSLANQGTRPFRVNYLTDTIHVTGAGAKAFDCTWVTRDSLIVTANPTQTVSLRADCSGLSPAQVESVTLSTSLGSVIVELRRQVAAR